MKRYKRLYVVLAVLLAACIATFALSRYKAQKEQIQTSGETILSISADEVESLSWDYDGQTLSFHRDGAWSYDDDAAFPVDAEQMNLLLEPFAAFGAAFIIEDVDDLGQYGLDNPGCTSRITAGGETHTIQLGDYSKMDAQRYVSIGDGNVYLAAHDPLDEFDVTLDELIDQDDIPAFGQVSELRFSGAENYAVSYQEDGGNTYREDDVYFTERDGAQVPLDPDRVEDYLQAIQSLSLTDCVTYSANDDDLQSCGLDSPELTIEVAYDGEDGASGTFTLNVSRDPDERAAEAPADGESEEEVTAYARVGQSKLLYQITGAEYEALMAASYDALRHQEVLPAALEDISQVDVTLEGETCTLTAADGADGPAFAYQGETLENTDFQSALQALTAVSFTDEAPTGKEEITLTLHLEGEGSPSVQIALYRFDGENCLATLDGKPLCLVDRSAAVALIEAVHAIVLN